MMKKRKSATLFAATIFTAGLIAVSGTLPATAQKAAATGDKPTDIFLASSGPGSSYYPLMVALSVLWTKNISGINVSLVPGGGIGAVISTGNATAQVGMTLSSAAVDGINGRPPFKEKYPDVRAMAALDPQAFQYLAYKASGLTKYVELRGKSAYVKPKNFASHALNLLIMSVHDMTLKSFSKAETVGKSDAISLFKDGHLDALLWNGPVPDSLLMDASFNRPIQLLEISDAKRKEIQKLNPGILPYVLPKGLYPGVDEDFDTLAVARVLVMSKDVSDDLAYDLTKTMVEKWGDLELADVALKKIEVKGVVTDFGVTFHPGVTRYYKERGWMK